MWKAVLGLHYKKQEPSKGCDRSWKERACNQAKVGECPADRRSATSLCASPSDMTASTAKGFETCALWITVLFGHRTVTSCSIALNHLRHACGASVHRWEAICKIAEGGHITVFKIDDAVLVPAWRSATLATVDQHGPDRKWSNTTNLRQDQSTSLASFFGGYTFTGSAAAAAIRSRYALPRTPRPCPNGKSSPVP